MSPLPDILPLSEAPLIEPTTAFSKPSRRLTRRVPSEPPTDFEIPKSPEPVLYSLLEAPTPARSSRLKRRVGVAGLDVSSGLESQAFSSGIEDTLPEPPLKKFRALFDASNPEQESLQTQTPAYSSRLKRRVDVAGLDVESGLESRASSLGIEDDIPEPPLKKFRALSDASNPERESLSTVPEQQEHEEEPAVLADFGDDTGLRGNFMVVVELEVYKKDKDLQNSVINHAWVGKPNFKRFKKKTVDSLRPRVELFLNDENVYGMGSSHRRGDKSRDQLRSENLPDDASQTDLQMLTQPKGRKKPTITVLTESDDDDVVPPICSSRARPPSRSCSIQPQKRTATQAEKVAKKNTLFLDPDDDDENNSMDVDPKSNAVDNEQTLHSSFETTPTQTVGRRPTRETRSRNPAPIIVDDDSDDDAVFKGFKGQKRNR